VNIHQGNLLFALRVAITDQRRVEREGGFTGDSALVAGLEDLYKHILAGGQIRIIQS
jgi:hypothetical protein